MIYDQYFKYNMNIFDSHIQTTQQNHNMNCGENCIYKVLELIRECIREYLEGVKISLEGKTNDEIMDEIISLYNSYSSFIVIMEDMLPSISKIIGKIPTDIYPYSLWKFLHIQFVKYIINPMKDQLIEILVKGIEIERKKAIEKAINRVSIENFCYQDFESICKLRTVSEILTILFLDEKSVHYLESTEYFTDDCRDPLEEPLKTQTESLYLECLNKSTTKIVLEKIILDDVEVLERILLPCQIKKSAENCAHSAQAIWGVQQIQLDKKFKSYNMNDAKVGIYIQKLSAEE